MVILAGFVLGAEIVNRSRSLIVMVSFMLFSVLAHGAHVCLLNFFGLYFGDPFAWLSLVIYFSAEVLVGCMICLRTILSPGFKMGGIVPYEIDYSPGKFYTLTDLDENFSAFYFPYWNDTVSLLKNPISMYKLPALLLKLSHVIIEIQNVR
jgi:hypothetical protein